MAAGNADRKRSNLLALLVLVAIAVVLFWPVLFGGRVMFFDDLRDDFQSHFIKRLMGQEGRLIWWSPFQFCGLPTLGNLQQQVLYPFSLPVYLLPTEVALSVFVMLHVVLGLLGTWLLARALDLPPAAAVVSAAAFTIGGSAVFHLGILPGYEATMWIPWQVLCVVRYMATRRAAWLAANVAVVGLQGLAGTPQMIYLSFIAAAVAFACAAVQARREAVVAGAQAAGSAIGALVRPLGALSLATVGGFALAGAALLPGLWIIRASMRGGGTSYAFATTYSLTPRSLWTLVSPFAMGNDALRPGEERGPLWSLLAAPLGLGESGYRGDWSLAEMGCYSGLCVLLLAAIALASHRTRLKAVLLACVGLGTWAALGPAGGLYSVLYHLLPAYGYFRAPCRFMLLATLALALLAGLGVEVLTRARDGHARRVPALAIGAMLVLSGLALASPTPAELRGSLVVPLGALMVATVASSLAALSQSDARRTLAATLACGMVLVDLVFVGHGFIRTVPPEATRPPIPPLARVKQLDPSGSSRVIVGTSPQIRGSLVPLTENYGLRNAQGRNSIALASYIQTLFFNEAGRFPRGREEIETLLTAHQHTFVMLNPATPLTELLNVRYFLAPPKAPGEWPGVIENPNALPRHWWAPRAVLEPDGERALAAVLSRQVDPRRTLLLARLPTADVPPPLPSAEGRGTVRLVRDDLDRLELDVEADAPGFLGTSEVYEAGWTARVNGQEAPVLRSFHTLLAVPVPAGRSHIQLRYEPPGLRPGLALSACGLVLLFGLLALDRRARRAQAATSP